MVAEALPLLCCIYSSCWPFKSGWWLGYTQENSTTYLNSFNWSATHKLTKSILTICTTSYSSSRSKASDLEVKRWSQQNHIHLQRTEPLMSPKLHLWSNEFRSQGPASLTTEALRVKWRNVFMILSDLLFSVPCLWLVNWFRPFWKENLSKFKIFFISTW